MVIGNKARTGHDETCVALEVIGDVRDRNVLLVDDFTITGGTLIAMAGALKDRGARDIYAAVSHGVLSKGAGAKIGASVIKKMFMTDTIEHRVDPLPPNLEVVSVASVFRGSDPFRSRAHERQPTVPRKAPQPEEVSRTDFITPGGG